MTLWQLYYHLVWTTRGRQPLITVERESKLQFYFLHKSVQLGAVVHAVGGTRDHVHLVVSVPPGIAIATFVKHLKGGSSYHLNQLTPLQQDKFAWQREYGVFSLGRRQLERAIDYVVNQKSHHSQGTTLRALEQTE